MYKERKETTHGEIGKEQHTSSYLYIKRLVQYMSINEWSQDQYT